MVFQYLTIWRSNKFWLIQCSDPHCNMKTQNDNLQNVNHRSDAFESDMITWWYDDILFLLENKIPRQIAFLSWFYSTSKLHVSWLVCLKELQTTQKYLQYLLLPIPFKFVQLLTQLLPSNLEVHFTSWPAGNINTDVYLCHSCPRLRSLRACLCSHF